MCLVLASLVDSRISPSSSNSKSYAFLIIVALDEVSSLFPLAVRVLLYEDESDDCAEHSRKPRYDYREFEDDQLAERCSSLPFSVDYWQMWCVEKDSCPEDPSIRRATVACLEISPRRAHNHSHWSMATEHWSSHHHCFHCPRSPVRIILVSLLWTLFHSIDWCRGLMDQQRNSIIILPSIQREVISQKSLQLMETYFGVVIENSIDKRSLTFGTWCIDICSRFQKKTSSFELILSHS